MKPLVLLFLSCNVVLQALSQTRVSIVDSALNKFAQAQSPERIYIHYDKPVYNAGETIWFKAYLMTGALPSHISKNFYIDWANDSGRVIAHNCYPIADASTHGQFDIPEDYDGQALHVQAYTKWMLNFDTAFLYRKNIRITQNMNTTDLHEVPPDPGDTLYLFPEGGDMIAGLSGRIAFKAVNRNEAPFDVSGYVTDSAGQAIDSFQSRHDGMGSFYLMPAKGQTYAVTWKDEKGLLHRSPLPIARPSGVNLRVQVAEGEKKFRVQRTDPVEDNLRQLHLVVTQYQKLIYEADINLEDQAAVEAAIPVSELHSGILRFTLFDKNWLPVAERISFVNNGEYVFSPTIHADTVSLEKRGLNVLSIDVPDSIQANLSVAITDAEVGTDSSDDIFSRLLLTSELKGLVYHPAYYFKDSSLQTQQDLDLVMLTNGWRRYNWQKILQGELPRMKYPKDSAYLYFSGQMTGKLPEAVKKVIVDTGSKHLLLFSVRPVHDTLSQVLTLPVDSVGRFGQPGLMVFDSLLVAYQFSDKKLNFRSAIEFMPDRINEPLPMQLQPTMTLSDIESRQKQGSGMIQQVPEEGITSGKGIQLKAVKVTAKAKTPEEILEEKYTSKSFFRGAFGYNIDVQDDINAKKAFDIFTYLQTKVIPDLHISLATKKQYNDAPEIKWGGNRSSYPPAIYYNETLVRAKDLYDLIHSISEIAYIKVIPPPSFKISMPADNIIDPPIMMEGAIAIYTKKGADYYSSLSTKLSQQIIIGYSFIKEFYSPDYSQEKSNNTADARSTLYWNPMILYSHDKHHFSIRFYNNDSSKSYRIIIDGMSPDGKLAKVDKLIN